MSIKNKIKGIFKLFFPPKVVKAEVSELGQNELLSGRKALITEGTGGIGSEMAKMFARSGAKVIITGRSKEKIEKVVNKINNELNDPGGAIYGLEMNLNDTDSLESCFKQAVDKLGSIDILVNNAGIVGGDFNTCTGQDFEKIMSTNVKGNLFLTRIAARYMIANRIKGNILNICSSSSLCPANCVYVLSKWAVRSMTEGFAKMLIPHDIVVNGIAPGPTATAMLGKSADDDISLPNNPVGRYATPQEIANMSVIMVSNMCRMVVGDILYMTGGSGNLTNEDVSYEFKL